MRRLKELSVVSSQLLARAGHSSIEMGRLRRRQKRKGGSRLPHPKSGGEGGTGTFALPLVVAAKLLDMFFELGFELGEGLFDAAADIGGDTGGMKGAGGNGEVERKGVLDFARVLFEAAVDLDEVGGKGLEETAKFIGVTGNGAFDGSARFFMLVSDRKFHERTLERSGRRIETRGTEPRRIGQIENSRDGKGKQCGRSGGRKEVRKSGGRGGARNEDEWRVRSG